MLLFALYPFYQELLSVKKKKIRHDYLGFCQMSHRKGDQPQEKVPLGLLSSCPVARLHKGQQELVAGAQTEQERGCSHRTGALLGQQGCSVMGRSRASSASRVL